MVTQPGSGGLLHVSFPFSHQQSDHPPLPQLPIPKEDAKLLHLNTRDTGTGFFLASALSCVRRGQTLPGLTLEGQAVGTPASRKLPL